MTVTVRGRARSRGARVVLLRCLTTRCAGTERRVVTTRVIRRGRSRLAMRLRSKVLGLVRVELRSGHRTLGAVRLRPAARRPGGTPSPSPSPAPAAADETAVPTPEPPARGFSLSVTPELTPAYARGVTDHTLRCDGESSVTVEAVVPEPQTLAIDGASPTSGNVRRGIELEPGQGFTFTVTDSGGPSTHHVRCVPGDFPVWETTRSGTPDVEWIAFAPSLGVGAAPYSIVADDRGVPLWWMRAPSGLPIDAKVLPDGTVAWARYLGVGGYSQTSYERFALDGTPLGTLSPAGIGADHHDLQMLPGGNFLMLAYRAREHVDLSSMGGPEDATVLDAEVHEVTPTGAPVWSWNSADHIELEETADWGLANTLSAYAGQPAYDVVHVNSVEQQPDGTLLLSFRHLNAVYSIRRSDGGINWKLGGTTRPESLTVDGDPLAPALFGGQHDARQQPDGTISVHDNGTGRGRPERTVRYRIDASSRTATLVEELSDARVGESFCCGSSRRLPGGHWLMNWDTERMLSELDARGSPVLTLRFVSGYSYRAQPVPSSAVDGTALRSGMDAMHPR